MRKLGAALLAVPVLASIYLAAMVAHRGFSRVVAAIGAGAVIAVVLVASLPPAQGAAVPPSTPAPVSAQVLDAVQTGQGVTKPIHVRFGAPMDAPSVAGALRVSPDAAISLTWDASGRELSIAPAPRWHPDTLYTVTVDASARSAAGGRLQAPVRVVVLTAAAGTGTVAATRLSGNRARLDTAFRFHFDRSLPLASVRSALRTEPAIVGDLAADAATGDVVLTPAAPLVAGTHYRVWLAALVDADGTPFALLPSADFSTVSAADVVRFRPRADTKDVARTSLLSVRFTQAMDRASTASAFRVTANGSPVKGTTSWAEGHTVLVFRPAAALPYGATVAMTVGAGAEAKGGAPVSAATTATFKVEAKPAARPKPPKAAPHRSAPKKQPIHHGSGGGGAASGSWRGVEAYYLRLMNCTRTGGWVTSHGSCSSPGGRNVAPLWISTGISNSVSRPYARYLATHGACDHFIGGTPGDRLRRAGYRSYRWGENLGCRSGNPYSAVLGSHLYFQSEKPYRGGHYVNLMNAQYDRVGIGVWVSGGRVRLVVDFYHP